MLKFESDISKLNYNFKTNHTSIIKRTTNITLYAFDKTAIE